MDYRKKVLVIDDDAAIRRVMEYSLSRHGYNVSLAENGADGVDSVATEAPDAAILLH